MLNRIGIITILLGLSSVEVFPAEPFDSDSLALHGVHLIYNLQIEAGMACFDQLMESEPDNPRGEFLKAASYYWLVLTAMSDPVTGKQFQSACESAIDRLNQYVKHEPENLDYQFYQGSLYMALGGYYGLQKSWWNAYWKGKKGKNILQRVVAQDSTYYDAYVSLGMYYYYSEMMPKLLKFFAPLLGIDGDRQKGLSYLKQAAEHGTYAVAQAKFCLADIYLRWEKHVYTARHLFRELHEAYPHNWVFQLGLADCYRRVGQPRRAIAALQPLIVPEHSTTHPELVRVAYYLLGRAYYALNEFEVAKTYFSRSVADSALNGRHHYAYFSACYHLGVTQELLGDRHAALEAYQRVTGEDDVSEQLQTHVQNRIAQPLLPIDQELIQGENWYYSRHYAKAMDIYHRLLAQIARQEEGYPSSKRSEVHYQMGRVHYSTGHYHDAIHQFDLALHHLPAAERGLKSQIHFRLGTCYRLLGEAEKALSEYDRAYKLGDSYLRTEVDRVRHGIQH
ncbi:MAG: DUF3808 domain-containing protein [Gemmatimonadetes bacterium]|nr:MAG: DUF3808 domain-containing protein [Gemmatimonadota bacterium]